ncbi:MAG: hypothetical protein KKH83_05180, partial [Candidatus Margulisbacteria bacterium]|nr:hypothetical protein [Candidatus Margulisiibacteriota bacterium]
FIAILMLISLMLPAMAGQAGTDLAVLKAGVGARALGMGSAFTAIANNADAPYWNPAGLGEVHKNEITTMQTKLSTDTDHYYLSYVVPWGKGSVGISWIQMGLGSISETSDTLDGFNEVQTISIFNYYSNAFLFSYGLPVSDKISLGLTAKYLISDMTNIAGGQATGYSFTPGILLKPSDKFTIGFKVDELLNESSWGTGNIEKAIPKARLGFALTGIANSTLAIDISQQISARYTPELCAGYEWSQEGLAFRLGFADSALTAGAGFTALLPQTKGGTASVDYAYVQQSSLSRENVHRVSLSGKW